MKVHVVDEDYNEIEVIDYNPDCAELFCECCGDCAKCYGYDPCTLTDDEEHLFVLEESKVVESRKSKHPTL